MRPVKHDKTGTIYLLIEEIIDCTNSEKDKPMILYMNLDGKKFVREKSEFWMKFSSIDSSDVHHIDRKKVIEKTITIEVPDNSISTMGINEAIAKELDELNLNIYKVMSIIKVEEYLPNAIRCLVKYTVLEENL